MTTFLWVQIALLAANVIASLCVLTQGKLPQKTPAGIACNVVLEVAIIVWAAILLAS